MSWIAIHVVIASLHFAIDIVFQARTQVGGGLACSGFPGWMPIPGIPNAGTVSQILSDRCSRLSSINLCDKSMPN